MSVFAVLVFSLFALDGLGRVDCQTDALENWKLTFVLCNELQFHEVYRAMRLDVNCYQHVGLYQDQLCVQVIIQ